jgi:hypothetical protein
MMIGSHNSDTINQSIDQWVGKVILYYTDPVSSGQPPSISGLQSHLFPNKRTITRAKSPDSVVMWFNRFIREHTNKGRPLSLFSNTVVALETPRIDTSISICGKRGFTVK